VKSKAGLVIAAVLGVVMVVAVLSVARMSRSDSDRAMEQANVHADRAMRLLAKYQANLAEIGLLREQLGRQLGKEKASVSVPPKGSELQEVVRGDIKSFQELGKRAKKGPAAELEQRLRQLVPDASSLSPEPSLDLGQNESQITRGLEKSIKQVEVLIVNNSKVLKQALREAEAALQIQVGSADMRNHVTANHLKAWAQHLMGLEGRNESLGRRLEAQRIRLQALYLSERAGTIGSQIRDLESRLPKQAKERVVQQEAEMKKALAEAQQQAGSLKEAVEQRRKQVAAVQAQAEAAGKALLSLEAKGYDPKNPQDVKRYTDAYAQHAMVQQKASIQAMVLQAGTLEGARLDDAHGGDLMKDEYVPQPGKKITPTKGLVTLEAELDDATKRVAEYEELLKESASRAVRLDEVGKGLSAEIEKLKGLKKSCDEQVSGLLNQADSFAAQAAKAESDALQQLETAGKTYGLAARAAGARSEAAVSDPAVKKLAEDKDTEAAMQLGQASAFYMRATILLQQIQDIQQQIVVLMRAVLADVSGVDKGRLEKLVEEQTKARDQAIKVVDEAIKLGSRNPVKGNYKWVGQASVAAAYHLKSLMTSGTESAEALSAAMREYEGAVLKGEAIPFLRPYVHMRDYIRTTSAPASAPSAPTSSTSQPTAKAEAPK